MKPKILFIYDHKYPDLWRDGLWAALKVLEEDFEIELLNLYPDDDVEWKNEPDLILGWGGFNSLPDQWINPFRGKGKMGNYKVGLCIGGNVVPPITASDYDVLFYETKWYRPQIDFHPNIVQAFGVNTDIFFEPGFPVPMVWDYIGVGSFSSWKRWELMKEKKGNRLVIGEYQKDNEKESLTIARDLLVNGVMVSDMTNPVDLANLYRWSRTLYMPSDINGGGERAILEARACGCKVEIEDDNPKLKELLTGPIPSHIDYANQLKKGILSCLSV